MKRPVCVRSPVIILVNAMRFPIHTVSQPVTGKTARRLLRAVERGGCLVNAQGRAFIESLLPELGTQAKASPRISFP